jgi:hypothetical protein
MVNIVYNAYRNNPPKHTHMHDERGFSPPHELFYVFQCCVCTCWVNPAQQVDYFHSTSADRRDSLFYYTRSEFQNIRILRFLSDIVWSISIHTDKKRNRAVFIVFVSGMLGCIYQIIYDLILDF